MEGQSPITWTPSEGAAQEQAPSRRQPDRGPDQTDLFRRPTWLRQSIPAATAA